MTQKAVAEMSGIAGTTLNRIEKGKQSPDTETLRRIAGVLDVALDDLARPKIARTSGSEILKMLDESKLSDALRITDEERRWVEDLPVTTWLNAQPRADVIAQFIIARRQLAQTRNP